MIKFKLMKNKTSVKVWSTHMLTVNKTEEESQENNYIDYVYSRTLLVVGVLLLFTWVSKTLPAVLQGGFYPSWNEFGRRQVWNGIF